ncbi:MULTISPECIES: homoserine kinase [Catenuloplanes]|uniref:Homoserine kinase n=1 Tax=Catenuloplanes niger TaxID=587534 RepID=A0AAE4CTZ8_9ACTN|nr:homoserine kinase [Catenuloplanes niger]MDR7324625.1 homoserine kinase [Catenuloplanes niger]
MALSFVSDPVTVRAPATSANLGPGFDALGLALALHDHVTGRVTDDGCVVTVTGQGAGELPSGPEHLVARAAFAAFDVLGARPPGLALDCDNRIPQARGLGSSSAAIVAGIEVARSLVVGGRELMDDAAALRLANEIEGHPDNVAPCLLGGFTIAWTGADGAHAVRLAPSAAVHPTVFVPDVRGLTAHARAALPAEVPHADAARNAGRAALLVHALTTAPELLLPATEDRLHQDYRAPGMPESAALVRRLRAAGVAAVISGAGPSVLALTQVPGDFDAGDGWAATPMSVDADGAGLSGSTLGHAKRYTIAAGRKS